MRIGPQRAFVRGALRPAGFRPSLDRTQGRDALRRREIATAPLSEATDLAAGKYCDPDAGTFTGKRDQPLYAQGRVPRVATFALNAPAYL